MSFQNRSSLSSHESIEEIEETVLFRSKEDSRSRAAAPYPLSAPNRSPAATEDKDYAKAATYCRASHSTRTSTPHPFHAPVLEYMTSSTFYYVEYYL